MGAGAGCWLLSAGDVSERSRRRVRGRAGGGGGGEMQGQIKVGEGRSEWAAESADAHTHIES